jgi:hypothetical protein
MQSFPSNNSDRASSTNNKLMSFRAISALSIIKQWSRSAYKCTKQVVSEKMGKCSRTVDPDLDSSIEVLLVLLPECDFYIICYLVYDFFKNLRDFKAKYENLISLSKKLAKHFLSVVQTQRAMADCFAELARNSPELIDEFTSNAETQRCLIKNGETLISQFYFIFSSLQD